jgi:hypothetical protein
MRNGSLIARFAGANLPPIGTFSPVMRGLAPGVMMRRSLYQSTVFASVERKIHESLESLG